jgi:hypothetical protein
VKLNPELSWKKELSTEEDSFHQQYELKFKEENIKCKVFYGAEISENRLEIL